MPREGYPPALFTLLQPLEQHGHMTVLDVLGRGDERDGVRGVQITYLRERRQANSPPAHPAGLKG